MGASRREEGFPDKLEEHPENGMLNIRAVHVDPSVTESATNLGPKRVRRCRVKRARRDGLLSESKNTTKILLVKIMTRIAQSERKMRLIIPTIRIYRTQKLLGEGNMGNMPNGHLVS